MAEQESRGRFTKEQTLSLINEFGNDYFNPNMLKDDRQKLLLTITQRDEFEKFSVDEIRQKLEYLGSYFKNSSITWKYYEAMHKIMQSQTTDPGNNSMIKSSPSTNTLPGCVVEEEKTPIKRGRPKKDAKLSSNKKSKIERHDDPTLLLESLRLLTKKQADNSITTEVDMKQIAANDTVEKNDTNGKELPEEVSQGEPLTKVKVQEKVVFPGLQATPKVTLPSSTTPFTPSVVITRVDQPRLIVPRREFLELKADVAKIRSEITEIAQNVQSFSAALIEHSKANGEKMDSILEVLKSLSDGFKVRVDSNLKQ